MGLYQVSFKAVIARENTEAQRGWPAVGLSCTNGDPAISLLLPRMYGRTDAFTRKHTHACTYTRSHARAQYASVYTRAREHTPTLCMDRSAIALRG